MSFKICLIGCGRHSRLVHGPSLRKYALQNPIVKLAGACDLHLPLAQAFAKDFGFSNAYGDIGAMIERERPDAVSLVLPPHLTCSACIPIVEKGIPVLIEKPPSMTGAEFGKLMEAAERGHAITQVAFNRRYTDLLVRTRELLEANVPPKAVLQIDYDMIRYDRRDPDFSTTAIHAVDALLFLARSPYRQVCFHYLEKPEIGPGVADIVMEGCCESGAQIRLNIQPLAGVVLERASIHALGQSLMVELPMWGTKPVGSLRYWREDSLELEMKTGGSDQEETLFEQSGFFAENQAFFDAVQEGRTPSPSVKESWQPVVLMEAIRNRASAVSLPDFQFIGQTAGACYSQIQGELAQGRKI
jgi:myo-inositol 2-dehydrogenase / D-chiro-inositol 1-dehydrogenase